MKKDMGINGGRWYICCSWCDGCWRKMVVTVLQVRCAVIFVDFLGVQVLNGLYVWGEV